MNVAGGNFHIKRNIAFCMLLGLIFSGGCEHSTPGKLPVTTMRIGEKSFTLEIAVSEHDQEVGLMHRPTLDADHGMIFINSDEQVRTFWNHDVHFPLDLLFLGTDVKIVSIKRLEPFDDRNVSSDVPARYVIELNAGTAKALHLSVGDQLALPSDVQTGNTAR
ncbi:MAG: DUF192 domain-containing protein [Planctomycetota bacterium]|nr:DUF192 domain-containing protein [Planctomycetota bacterium]